MIHQAQIHLPGFPLLLLMNQNATVEIAPTQLFTAIIDSPEDVNSVSAVFDNNGFSLLLTDDNKEEYNYNSPIEYKEDPLLMQWLKQQKLTFNT